jgi:hypothetical protein
MEPQLNTNFPLTNFGLHIPKVPKHMGIKFLNVNPIDSPQTDFPLDEP